MRDNKYLITTRELKDRLDEALVVDVRSWYDYRRGHIPSSINLDLFAFHFYDTSKKGIEVFNKMMINLLASIGINYDKFVVLYDDISGILAARGLWLFHYFSHYNCVILDGGLSEWKKEYEIEHEPNIPKPTPFYPTINYDVLATLDDVLNRDAILIDARSKEEYEGSIVRAARGGHIPNAINVDWRINLNNNKFKDVEELASIYYKIIKDKDKEIICYCHGAYRASHTYVALKILGINSKVYLGSWYEYGNRLDLPVE